MEKMPKKKGSRFSSPSNGPLGSNLLHKGLTDDRLEDEKTPYDAEPAEVYERIADTVAKFDAGDISLYEALQEMGINPEDFDMGADKVLPRSNTLREKLLYGGRRRRFHWEKGVLYSAKSKDGERFPEEELAKLYELAKPVTVALWDAEKLLRDASKEKNKERMSEMSAEAETLRESAESNKDGLRARNDIHDIYEGLVLKHVLRKIRRYRSALTGPNDLMQEGRMGLDRAIALFDPKIAGAGGFDAFASFHINARIGRYINLHRTIVQLPDYLASKKRKNIPNDTSAAEASKDPEIDQRRKVKLAMLPHITKLLPPEALDQLTMEEIGRIFPDHTPIKDPYEETAENNARKLILESIQKKLTPRQQKIILAFMHGATLDEIAEEHSLSPQRIQRIKVEALRILRHALHNIRDTY